jgi:hypothetical protein
LIVVFAIAAVSMVESILTPVKRILLMLTVACAACGSQKPAAVPVEAGTVEAVRGSLEVSNCERENDRDTRCQRFVFSLKNTGPGCVDATTLGGYIDLQNGVRTTNIATWELDEKDPAVFAVGETRRAR